MSGFGHPADKRLQIVFGPLRKCAVKLSKLVQQLVLPGHCLADVVLGQLAADLAHPRLRIAPLERLQGGRRILGRVAVRRLQAVRRFAQPLPDPLDLLGKLRLAFGQAGEIGLLLLRQLGEGLRQGDAREVGRLAVQFLLGIDQLAQCLVNPLPIPPLCQVSQHDAQRLEHDSPVPGGPL